MKNNELGQTLIVLLIVVVVISFLVIKFLMPTGEKGTTGKTLPTEAIEKAKDINCVNNLRTVRIAVESYKASEGSFPSSLNQLYPDFISREDLLKCPIGGEAYKYDSSTGEVKCIHSGHENF